MLGDIDYIPIQCMICESWDTIISPPEPFICFECEKEIELSKQDYLNEISTDVDIPMKELRVIRVDKDGKATRCPDCGDIVLECTENHLVAIDTDFLEHMQQNCKVDDPMHEFYNGIDPESLPLRYCPDCALLSEAEEMIPEHLGE